MADEDPGAEPVVHSNGAVDFSLRSPHLDEIEDLCSRFIVPNKLSTSSRIQKAESKLSVHGVKDLGVFTIAYGAELTAQAYPTDLDDRLAFVIAKSGAGQAKIEGREFEFTPEQGVIIPPGPELFMRYQSDCETDSVVLSRGRLAEQCEKLLGYEIGRPLEFDKQLSLESAAGRSLRRLGRYVADELRDPLSMTRQLPTVAQQLEQMVASALLLGHSHTYSEALLRPQSAAAPFYVRRAEAFIEAHYAEPLSLAAIAAHAGVSARSLQNGFQHFRNRTPMGFLRLVRLQRAQEALLRADDSYATVTEIALSCGFSHLGEFSNLYRRTFGETPKQTLGKTIYR